MQDYLEEVSGELEKEAIRKEALLDARESLEKAIDIKDWDRCGKQRSGKNKKAMEEKEHGRKTGTAGGY